MVEHPEFIRGLLDPTEKALIEDTNDLISQFSNLGIEFDRLMAGLNLASDKTIKLSEASEDNIKVAEEIRNFKAQATQGILACEIKSIIVPLLDDYVLRETNHYFRLLETP